MSKPSLTRTSEMQNCLRALDRLQSAISASGDVIYEWDLATDRIDFTGDTSSLFGALDAVVPETGEQLQARVTSPC